jgi:hypothetical protein
MPAVKLLMVYNVKPAMDEAYYRFMAGEFLPAVQNIGLIMVEAWRTAWGDYPQRLIALVAEDHRALDEILDSKQWRDMETKLRHYVKDYRRQIVVYRSGFQFLKPS